MGKLKLAMSAAAACFAASTQAWAQQTQAPAAPAPSQPNHAATPAANDEVVVTGQHSDDTGIDRHVYSVRNDPIAQTSSVNDILARLPAVTVAPSGQIRLLGSTPTIQIDGQTVPNATLAQVLRTMTGDQIDRIEIITNPGAQYSASTSGGIINIVTRQTFGRGLGGTLVGSYDTYNNYVVTLGPTWTRGPYSIAGRLGYNHGQSHAETTLTRDIFATSDVVTQLDHLRQQSTFENEFFSFGYRPNNRTNTIFSIEHNEGDSDGHHVIEDSHPPGPLFSERQHGPSTFNGDRGIAGYTWNGSHNGESLTLNATITRFSFNTQQITSTAPASGPATAFLSPSPGAFRNASFKLDYQRTFGTALLSAGAGYDFNRQDQTSGFITTLGPPSSNDFFEVLHGRQATPAFYATYQFPVGHLTLLPGLRFEDFEQDVHSSATHAKLDDPRLLPTLHVRRNLMPGLDLDASFTRRISHQGIGAFDPAVRFTDATHASTGNPNLRPSLTNAFELSLTYQSGPRSFAAVFYDRITDDNFATAFTVRPDGVTVSQPINSGANTQRGVQVSIGQPLWPHWRLTTTFNLLDRSFDQLASSGLITRGEDFEYNGNATLEYRDADQNRIGAQQIQITAQWQGPQHSFQSVSDNYAIAGVTWRRTLTDRVAAQLQLYDIFDSGRFRNTFRTDQIEERSVTHNFGGNGGRRLQFVLTYKLAAPPVAAQSAPQAPPLPAAAHAN